MMVNQLLVLSLSVVVCCELCVKLTPNLETVLKCVNVNRRVLKVAILTRTPKKYIFLEDFLDTFFLRLNSLMVPFMIKQFHNGYEMPVIDFTERFSWAGEKFEFRPTQENQTVIFDGIDTAHPGKTYIELKSSSVLIIVEDIDVLDDYLEGSVRPPFQVPRTIYNIFIASRKEGSEGKIEKVLRKLWRNYGIIVAILVFMCEDNEVNYMEHFIMKSGATNVSDYFSWGTLNKAVVGQNLEKICDRDVENYPKDFNGFPLRVFMFEEEPLAMGLQHFPKSFKETNLGKLNTLTVGYNGLITAGLMEYLNFTPQYIIPTSKAEKYAYKSKEGILMGSGRVAYSKYDFVGMLHFIIGKQGMDYEFLPPVLFDRYCIIAPKPKIIPFYLAPALCFTPLTWIIIFLVPFYSTAILRLFNFSKNSYSIKFNLDKFIMFCRVQASVVTNIKTKSGFERWLLSGCMFFSVLFVNILNANLSTHITTEKRYNDIKSLKELADLDLKIVTSSQFMLSKVFGTDNRNDVYRKLKNSLELGDSSIETAVKGKNCVIRMQLNFEITNNKITIEHGEEKVYLINECPTTYHSAYIVRRGWSHAEILNRKIQLLVETGFVRYWTEASRSALELKNWIAYHKRGIKARIVQLNLNNCWLWFIWMLGGNLVATSVFCYEVFEKWGYQKLIFFKRFKEKLISRIF
ncbi:hypothetical protein ACFFRR_011338 [Megaselia abdita]